MVDMDDADQLMFLRSLRAVRRYADRPIERRVHEAVLEVARWTGSGKNRQPWEVVVVEKRSTLQELSRLGRFASHLTGAAAAYVLVMDSAEDQFDEGRLAQNLMLAAWAYGIGSCMATFSTEEDVQRGRELMSIPEDRWFRHSVALGLPADDAALRRARGAADPLAGVVPVGRKSFDSMVHWERYTVDGDARQGT